MSDKTDTTIHALLIAATDAADQARKIAEEFGPDTEFARYVTLAETYNKIANTRAQAKGWA